MRKLLVVAMLTACSSDSEPEDPGADAAVAEPPSNLPFRTYVIDDLDVPSTSAMATQYGLDLDNDGAIDNQLGNVIAALGSLGVDAPLMVSRAIDRGDTILLARVGTQSFTDTSIATFQTFAGMDPSIPPCASTTDTACRKHLQGGATFTAMPEPRGTALTGSFSGGTFMGSSGQLVVRLALLGSQPIDVVLLGSRAKIQMGSELGLATITLAGAVSAADIDAKIIPAVRNNLMASVTSDCTAPTSPPACGCATNSDGKSALGLFDKAPVDCKITLDEIKNNGLIQSLLAPDVMVEGQMALSLGVRASAKSAGFTAP